MELQFIKEENRIYCQNAQGKLLAEITFPAKGPDAVDINHTFVDDSLRGQGVAGRLMEETVQVLSSSGRKAFTSCSYAAAWAKKHPLYRELFLSEEEFL